MQFIQDIIDNIQEFLWTYINIALLVGCALYFTVRSRFVQFRLFGDMLKAMMRPEKNDEEGKKHISSFQAFVVALASRIGTGNLAGVAVAISVGGPGAVFWMWVMALFGAATAFVESTLAQLYKRKGKKSFYGGPAYYMKYGLGKSWMGVVFSLLMILTFGWANNAMQSNTIALAWEEAFGIPTQWMGVVLTVFTMIIIFGGIHRIARVSSAVVPVMAAFYLLLVAFIIVVNIGTLPHVFRMILENAFGIGQVAGGTFGTVVMLGIKRGLFSNEAGEGSAPNAAATASVSHPVTQGLIQALGVFADTLVVCSCTAFLILCSGVDYTAFNGIQLTQTALCQEIGPSGSTVIALIIMLFAFSTIIANCYYGETNVIYITKNRVMLFLYRFMAAAFVMLGTIMSLDLAWSLIDLCMALITICNLIAIVLLFPKVRALLDDYLNQRNAGQKPRFSKSTLPEIADSLEAWEE